MANSVRLSTAVAALVVALVVLCGAGCVTISSDEPTPASVEEDLETATPPEEVSAALEVTYDDGDGNATRYAAPVWLRDDGTSRVGDADRGDEFVRVDDGERVWYHDVANGSVAVRDSNATDADYLSFLYGEQERILEEYAITSVEETTVDGREAYHVVLDPPPEETVERSIGVVVGDTEYVWPLETRETDADTRADRVELWLDREHSFPLAYRAEADAFELTVEYADAAFDEGISDDRFVFEPPASATVDEFEVER